MNGTCARGALALLLQAHMGLVQTFTPGNVCPLPSFFPVVLCERDLNRLFLCFSVICVDDFKNLNPHTMITLPRKRKWCHLWCCGGGA